MMKLFREEVERFVKRPNMGFELIFWLVSFSIAFSFSTTSLVLFVCYVSASFLVHTSWCVKKFFGLVRDQSAGGFIKKLGMINLMLGSIVVGATVSESFLASAITLCMVYALAHDFLSNFINRTPHVIHDDGFADRFEGMLRQIIFSTTVIVLALATVGIQNVYISGISLGVLATISLASAFVTWERFEKLRLDHSCAYPEDLNLETKLNNIYDF